MAMHCRVRERILARLERTRAGLMVGVEVAGSIWKRRLPHRRQAHCRS
jgi:hypothetical protein